MKFFMLINLYLLTTANSFLLNIAEHENFSANKLLKNGNITAGSSNAFLLFAASVSAIESRPHFLEFSNGIAVISKVLCNGKTTQ